jgi:FAD synthase
MGTVELVSQLRGQVKYVSVDALVDQMTVDVAQTRRALAGASPV